MHDDIPVDIYTKIHSVCLAFAFDFKHPKLPFHIMHVIVTEFVACYFVVETVYRRILDLGHPYI